MQYTPPVRLLGPTVYPSYNVLYSAAKASRYTCCSGASSHLLTPSRLPYLSWTYLNMPRCLPGSTLPLPDLQPPNCGAAHTMRNLFCLLYAVMQGMHSRQNQRRQARHAPNRREPESHNLIMQTCCQDTAGSTTQDMRQRAPEGAGAGQRLLPRSRSLLSGPPPRRFRRPQLRPRRQHRRDAQLQGRMRNAACHARCHAQAAQA